MHKRSRQKKLAGGRGGAGKDLVMGLLDRETGKVRVKHVTSRDRQNDGRPDQRGRTPAARGAVRRRVGRPIDPEPAARQLRSGGRGARLRHQNTRSVS